MVVLLVVQHDRRADVWRRRPSADAAPSKKGHAAL